MSDSVPLATVLSSPENSGQQQVTAPKLLFPTKEKPTTISSEEDSSKSSSKSDPPKPFIPSPDESPITTEQDSEALLLSPDLAQAFKNVEQLPGKSFLQDIPNPDLKRTCIFNLHHSTLSLLKGSTYITRTRPIDIDQLINSGDKPTFRPKWKLSINKRLFRIIDGIANELGSEPSIINEILSISDSSSNFFEPCSVTNETLYPTTFEDLCNTLNGYRSRDQPIEITVMLDTQPSRLFGTIVRTGVRELSSVRSTTSSRRTQTKSQKSPVAEVHIHKTTHEDDNNDELTHNSVPEPPPSKEPNSVPNQRDPRWDSFERDNFSYRGGHSQVLAQRMKHAGYEDPKSPSTTASKSHLSNDQDPSEPSNDPSSHNEHHERNGGYPEGPHWTHYVINPYEDIIADPTTGSIRPWYAIKHELGRTLNFPLNLGNLQIDKDLFLAQFIDSRYDGNTHFKSFMYRFPQFPDEDGPGFRHQIIPFLYQVSQHCVGFSVYVPPPHTLRPGDKLGAWYSELPIWTQRQIPSTFDNLLAQALRQKSTNLSGHKRLAPFVRTPKQGYDMIMALAIEAGHPSLQQFPETPKEPRQNSDTSIIKYIDNWSQYLQRMVLTGHHYNDRFFYQQLYRNSHPTFKPIFNELRLAVHEQNHRRPLPPSFYMTSLLTKITQLAQFIDSRVDVTIGSRELQKTYKPSPSPLKIAQTTQSSSDTSD